MIALRWLLVVAPGLAMAAVPKSSRWRTNATYVNDASTIAADPYVRWDAKTGTYWAYSTDGADEGWHFGIYTSPDLSTWSKASNGAIKAGSTNLWTEDWFWAPECYYNVRGMLLFYPGHTLTSSLVHRKRLDGISCELMFLGRPVHGLRDSQVPCGQVS